MKRILVSLAVGLAACGGFGDDSKSGQDGAASNGDQGTIADFGCSAPLTITNTGLYAPTTLYATSFESGSATPSWSVAGPDGTLLPFQYLDSSNLRIAVDANTPGTYTFQVTFADGFSCPASGSVVVQQPAALSQAYRLRLTPPASSQLPQQDLLVEVQGNTPQTAYSIVLQSGSTLMGTMSGASGALAGQVALTPQSGPAVLDAFGASGQFSVPFRLDGMYSLLLQPSSPSYAPHLVGPIDGATLLSSAFVVGTGVVVSGVVRDASSQPLPGANVVLHSGLRPSSLGTADSTGAYSLHVEPATASLLVSANGWPDISLDNLAITSAATIGVDEKVARLAVTLKVVRGDGATPIAGAHVSLRSASIANAATVHTASGDLSASGVMHVELVTGSDGTATTLLPASAYDVLVDPGTLPSGATDGITGQHVSITSAGNVTLALAAQVSLAGSVVDQNGKAVANVRVRATPQAGSVIIGQTASDGTFTLTGLGAGLPVTLDASPPASAKLAGVTQKLGDATMLGSALPSSVQLSLPSGLELAGTIQTAGNLYLSGVGIDVLCATCGSSTPLFHTDTSTGGGFTLYVPDPGVAEAPDAGPGLE